MPKIKIIVDTNLWISFLINKDQSGFFKIVNSKRVLILFSDELLHEFITVASRPKFQKYFRKNDIPVLMDSISDSTRMIKIISKVDLCRDKNDNFLLELSKDGNADFLITGDKDLLDLKKFGKTKIVTMTNFIRNFNKK